VLNLLHENPKRASSYFSADFQCSLEVTSKDEKIADPVLSVEEENHSTDDAKVEKDRVSVTMNSDEEEERIVHLKTMLMVSGESDEFEIIPIKIHAKIFTPTLKTILPPPLSRTSLSFRHDFGLQFVHERVRVHIPLENAPSRSGAWWRVQILRPPNPEPAEDPWLLLEEGIFKIAPMEGYLESPSSRFISFGCKIDNGTKTATLTVPQRDFLRNDFQHQGFLTVYFTPRETIRYKMLFNIEGIFGEPAIDVEIYGEGSPDQGHDVHQTF